MVETFQALIAQLQDNERELARLHELEKKRAEKSERFNERLIANIPSGLVAINSSGVVTSANVLAQEIFGAPEPGRQPAMATANSNELFSLAIDYRFLLHRRAQVDRACGRVPATRHIIPARRGRRGQRRRHAAPPGAEHLSRDRLSS